MSSSISLQSLAELVGGTLKQGNPETVLTGLNSLPQAQPGDISFLGNPKYAPALKTTQASAVLVAPDFAESAENLALIEVENPTLAFSAVIRHFTPVMPNFSSGVHPSAIVASSAVFDPQKVYIGPGAVIEDDVVLGNGCQIHAGTFIGHGVKLGTDCVLNANCTVKFRCLLGDRVIIHSGSVIGSDGFGYELVNGRHQKIDQMGIVQIDNDVEIGSCTTIDRARFGRTWIGEGTKIDNLVQIGHNVVLGKHCIICGQVGISGSTRIGNYVTMAGQVGVAGHLEIADKAMFLAKSGITKSVRSAGVHAGFPVKPVMESHRYTSLPNRIPAMLDRIKELEAKLARLEEKLG